MSKNICFSGIKSIPTIAFQQLREGNVVFILSSEYNWGKTSVKDHLTLICQGS